MEDGFMSILDHIFHVYFTFLEKHLWVGGLVEMSLLFFAIAQIICAAGLFCIFARMNAKRWPAAIPLSGIYWLGELIQRRVAAVLIVISKLMILCSCIEYLLVFYKEMNHSVSLSILFWTYDKIVISMCLLVAGAAFLIRFIAGLVFYGHLCGKYEVSKWWLVPFSLVPYVTMLFWSMNSKVREQF